jgi:LPS export ABC transporter protein LptC
MNNTQARYNLLQITRRLFPGVLFLSLLLTACKNDPKEIDALVGKNAVQEDKAYDVTLYYSEGGHTKVRLYAKEFVRNEVAKPPFIDMKKFMKVEFFDDSLNVTSTLTALYGRIYEKQENAIIRDSVVVVNKRGERLNTSELIWNQAARKFYTEKFVRITTATQMIFGDGLEANEDFTWYEIKAPKGVVRVNKSEMPE